MENLSGCMHSEYFEVMVKQVKRKIHGFLGITHCENLEYKPRNFNTQASKSHFMPFHCRQCGSVSDGIEPAV